MFKKIFYSFFGLYTVILIFATLAPAKYLSVANFSIWDKLLHFSTFGLWSAGFYIILVKIQNKAEWFSFRKAIIWGSVFGGLIELLQLTLPLNRSFEFLDFVADFLGALVFTFIVKLLFRTK